jgi:hypothetical protein
VRAVLRACAVLAAAAALAGCARVTPPTRPCGCLGNADFTNYVAVGNSLTAGYQSGGLLSACQDRAYPVLLAGQAGLATFSHPRIAAPGFPALLFLDWDNPAGGLPFSVHSHSGTGSLMNPGEAPYQNLGVPGARIAHFFASDSTNPMFRVLLGDRGTMWQQLKARHPRFVTFWLGSNDALEALLEGTPEVLTPAGEFAASYGAALDSVLSTGAQVCAANIPDILDTPYATTVPPYAFDPVTGLPRLALGQRIPFLGQRDAGGPGKLDPNSVVTLEALDYLAQGIGIPSHVTVSGFTIPIPGGTDQPLPVHVVLTPNEIAMIRARAALFNQTIATACAARNVPVMDAAALFHRVARSGYSLGGVAYSTRYVQGGIMSLDGVHPTDFGQALVANEWIATINAHYHASLVPVTLTRFLITPQGTPAIDAGVPHPPVAGLMQALQGVDWKQIRKYGL